MVVVVKIRFFATKHQKIIKSSIIQIRRQYTTTSPSYYTLAHAPASNTRVYYFHFAQRQQQQQFRFVVSVCPCCARVVIAPRRLGPPGRPSQSSSCTHARTQCERRQREPNSQSSHSSAAQRPIANKLPATRARAKITNRIAKQPCNNNRAGTASQSSPIVTKRGLRAVVQCVCVSVCVKCTAREYDTFNTSSA